MTDDKFDIGKKFYYFERGVTHDDNGGITVSRVTPLPKGEFTIVEYLWPGTSLWFIREQEFTEDERNAAYRFFRESSHRRCVNPHELIIEPRPLSMVEKAIRFLGDPSHDNTNNVRLIVIDWLRVNAEDDFRVISTEWLESIGFESGHHRGSTVRFIAKLSQELAICGVYGDAWLDNIEIVAVQTRGDVRLLLRALHFGDVI